MLVNIGELGGLVAVGCYGTVATMMKMMLQCPIATIRLDSTLNLRTLSKANLEPAPPDLFPLVAMIPISIRFSRSNGGLEEGAADFLVNTKLGMNGLTEPLARLENLSHILAWSDRVAWTFHGYAFVKGYFLLGISRKNRGKGWQHHLGINPWDMPLSYFVHHHLRHFW